MNVTVYSKKNCPACKFTMKKLDLNGTLYKVVNLDDDKAAEDLVASWGFTSVPVVDAGGTRWAGFSPDKLNALKVEPAAREVHRTAGVEDRTLTEDKG